MVMRVAAWGEPLARELRQAARALARRRGFTAVAVLTLALGIGASTALYSVFRSVVVRPLPYPEAERLVALDETFEGTAGFADGTPIWASYRSWITWRDRARSFEGIAAIRNGRATLELRGAARSVTSAAVSPGFFAVMGLEPIRGRTFTEEEARGRAAPVVVLSKGLWQDSFAGDPEVVGRTVQLRGSAATVIGIVPDGYRDVYTGGRQLWTPLYLDEARWLDSDARFIRLVGRLAAGVTVHDATREVAAIQAELASEFPLTHASRGGVVRELHPVLVRDVDARLRLLFAAAAFVLLIAIINVGGLILARSLERAEEWRVRASLGATRGRLLQTSLAESLLLVTAGGAAGVVVAWLGVGALGRLEGGGLPPGASISLDGVALAFAAAISVGSALLFSLIPVWGRQARRPSGARGGAAPGRYRLRDALVVAECSLAVVVLVALGLALRSYELLLRQDPGFEPTEMVTFEAALPEGRYATPESERAYFSALRTAIGELAGVEAVGAMEALPLERGAIWPVFIDGGETYPPGQEPQVAHRFTTPGAFSALGIEVTGGRDFTDVEFEEAAELVIVDQAFADRFWPGADPIGRHLRHFPEGPWLRVIGVVGATAQRGLEVGLTPTTWAPRTENRMHVVIRSPRPLEGLLPAVRSTMASLDPGVPVEGVRTGAMLIAGDAADRRFDWILLLAFAAAGLTLAAIGTYGSLSAVVLDRRSEFGVRRALGAPGRSIVGAVLGRAVGLALLGLVLGFGASASLGGVLEALLFGVPAVDPLTWASVAVLTLLVAAIAGLVPALRAASVDPVAVIRATHE